MIMVILVVGERAFLNVKVSTLRQRLQFFSDIRSHSKMKMYRIVAFVFCALTVRAVGVGHRNDEKRRTISFEEVKTLKDNTTVLLIDVRGPDELAATGKIPGSINIPLGTVETTLKDASSQEFLEKFKRERPKLDTPLVFTCRSGRRSEAAQDIALKLGFKDVRNFIGGWLEWEEKTNKL